MLMPSAHTRPLLLVHKVNYEPFAPAVIDLLRLRGGIDAAVWSDLTISILVLLGVAFAARSGSSLMAAVFSTAPTGVPLSLWLVHRASTVASADANMVEQFLLACVKGVSALMAFCLGALALVRSSAGTPSFAEILGVGFASWAVAWALLRRV